MSRCRGGSASWLGPLALPLVFGFLLLGGVTFTIALGLPVFHHVDELYHYDYCLKLHRGASAAPTALVEEDLYRLGLRTQRASTLAYLAVDLRRPDGRMPTPTRISYESYHPPLSYWLNALVLRAGAAFGVGLEGGVFLLRLVAAAMLTASRVLLFLALAHFGRPVALAALPYLLFSVPVDLLRISNDTLVVLLGAAVFWLLVRPSATARPGWTAAAVGALLLASVATKMNGLLYLLPAVALCLVLPGRDPRFRWPHLLAMGAPAVLLAAGMGLASFAATGDPTGSAHLARPGSPEPAGLRVGALVPTLQSWVGWHSLMLMIETQIAGRPGEELYPWLHLVSLVLLGRLIALGITLFGASPARLARLAWTAECFALLRRQVWAGAASVFVLLIVMSVLEAFVGRAYFAASRLFLPTEFLVVLAAAAGWAYLLAGEGPAWRALRVACWVGAAALFGSMTWPYLRFAVA